MPPAICNETRQKIVTLHQQGHSIRAISRDLCIRRNTVALWVRRYAKEGNLNDHRKNNHRPAIVNDDMLREMLREFKENGFTSVPTKEVAEHFNVNPKTIRNHLRAMDLHPKTPSCKRDTSDSHKNSRVHFARKYIHFDWTSTIFTDEKIFNLSDQGHLTLSNSHHNIDTVQPSKKSVCTSIKIWGWMSSEGVGELIQLPPQCNAANYVSMLEENILPSVRIVYPQNEVETINFVKDNCTVQRAKLVNTWFYQHPEISVIQWPPKSPDLNPMEYLWGVMVQKWDPNNERTEGTLEQHCQNVWENLRGTAICTHLVELMQSRLQAVIDADGS